MIFEYDHLHLPLFHITTDHCSCYFYVAAFGHYLPLHCAPAGLKYGRVGPGSSMEVTVAVAERLLRLPVWADLTDSQVSYVGTCLTEVLEACSFASELKSNRSFDRLNK